MTASPEKHRSKLASNRKALRDYTVLERLEAGVALCGTEVKSIRNGNLSLSGSFVRMEGREAVLINLNVLPYEHGNRFNHDPARPRRLLLHRKEIGRLQAHTDQKGHAVVPLSVYLKRGLVKVELGICKGKQHSDKREALRRKTADLEAARAIARHR